MLNHYTYTSNNPVRYTDPSGFFEEDQIMQYLGVNTWDEVLGMFGDEGQYAGSWGWLEVLRQAESGDDVSLWFHSADAYQTDVAGVLRDIEGTLIFQFDGGLEVPGVQLGVIGTDKAWGYSVIYGVNDRIIFNRKHNRFVDRGVDWTGVGFDSAGIGTDIFTVGIGGRAVNLAQLTRKAKAAGIVVDVLSISYTSGNMIESLMIGDFPTTDAVDIGLDLAGIPIPIVPDLISIGAELKRHLYYGP